MIEDLVKDITIEYLQKTEIWANVQKAIKGIEKAREIILAFANDESSDQEKTMRVGTIAIVAIIQKILDGKSIKDFSQQDWMDIAEDISENAILVDGQLYSMRVFSVYVNYIDVSVHVLECNGIPQKKCAAISDIAENVRTLSKELSEGKISEVDYTEECLWQLLEAMIKLLSTYSMILVGEDLAEFNQNVAMLAFEYGRYSLYKQEAEILELYLKHQEEVDSELEQKLKAYRSDLQERCNEFSDLISDAFNPDISKRLVASVNIARNVGVDDSEILDSVDKVDDYFL